MSFAAIDRGIAFAFDLPPQKPQYPCPNLPAWV